MLRWDPAALENRLAERMEADIASCEIAGAVAVVSQEGRPLCRVVRGSRDVATGAALRYDDLFRLASMTKVLTAAAVMLLIERGALHFEDKLSRYYPAFRERWIGKLDANGAAVPDRKAETELTIHHLLTHTNGVLSGPVGGAQSAKFPPESLASEAAYVEAMADGLLLDFEPGSMCAYSGIGAFDILARVVELTAGQPFEDFLARNLFAPLEMPDTTFTPSPAQLARLVALHDTVDGKSVNVDTGGSLVMFVPNSLHSGSASMLGTAEDYLHFAEMLANGGLYRGRRVMAEETVRAFGAARLSPTLAGVWPGANWGAGVMVRVQTVLPAGSFGWSGAFGTHFWADPANHLAAVYLRNSRQAYGAGASTAFRFEEDVMACCTG